jgi:hypothetical protein
MLVQTKNPRTPQMGYAVQNFRLPLAKSEILGLTLRNPENGILPLTGHLFRRSQHRFVQLHEPVFAGYLHAVWNFEAIEEAFSDAAVNPAVWARALNVVTAQTEAFGAILIPVTGNISRMFLSVTGWKISSPLLPTRVACARRAHAECGNHEQERRSA